MPNESQRLWEALLEEHHALCLPTADEEFPTLDEKKRQILRVTAQVKPLDQDAACLEEVYKFIHHNAKDDHGRPSKGMMALCLSGGGYSQRHL
jgi:hypothetical protein